ncbi:NAD(P)/FAD-dependent oxidoreductase [Caldimonas brevitalea]|uniref:Halogenase n=1 Tax=Caldimonas brevitalea TaxID=413882 RepID=A0A0G3BIX1_9BURK|nr:NAD(P)/FAD-dependent oxidoreductase [Caldimonas brevitalea]AKJ27306.1 hypothetical protein AAW51_0615 [Caldimonas brevitalea]
MKMQESYDVIICGGGLAGLTCARQLQRAQPQLSIAVLEKVAGPLPPAAHKVGEATVEGGAHYFTDYLGLQGYFNKAQLHKLGLRLFFGDPKAPFQERPELGARKFPRVPSYQIDRGVFENDLRRMVSATPGVTLIENAVVTDVDLAAGEEPHIVHLLDAAKAARTLQCRFMVDATGRRRLLHQKLNLGRENGHHISAAWWRMKGEYDIEKMAGPATPLWKPPHQERRWFSTNHLMGYGYWVWMIPLVSGHTSIGIVTDEAIHPIRGYNTYESSLEWLRRYEPTLATFLQDGEPLDFRVIKNASYHADQIFSHRRWACVGEAALFLDAFYSPGSDFIGYTNTIAVKMIEMDHAGQLTEEAVSRFNRFVLDDVAGNYLVLYRGLYKAFGSAPVMFTKVLWDTCFYWALPCQMMFRELLTDAGALNEFHEIAQQYLALNQRVQAAFLEWAPAAVEPERYTFVEYSKTPICAGLHLELIKDKTPEECFSDMRAHVRRFGEWADQILREAAVARGAMPAADADVEPVVTAMHDQPIPQ